VTPRFLARKRAIELGLFDPEWYRKAHVDVSMHGMDPFKHYIRHGWLEGRNASPVMGEDFLRQVIPDSLDTGRNPVMEILSRIRRGEFTEAALAEAMVLHEKMPKCATRLLPGITVAGFFGRSGESGEIARSMVRILDHADIPCNPFNLIPLEIIAEVDLRERCRQVMNRRAAIFLLDESSAQWAIRHLRPGRLNILMPIGDKIMTQWDRKPEGFDMVWDHQMGHEIQEAAANQAIGRLNENIVKLLEVKGVL
jgi:hypothetical protein